MSCSLSSQNYSVLEYQQDSLMYYWKVCLVVQATIIHHIIFLICISSNFRVFHTSGVISSWLAAFLLLIVFTTASSLTSVNYTSLKINLPLIISLVGYIFAFRRVSEQILEVFFTLLKSFLLFESVLLDEVVSVCTSTSFVYIVSLQCMKEYP